MPKDIRCRPPEATTARIRSPTYLDRQILASVTVLRHRQRIHGLRAAHGVDHHRRPTSTGGGSEVAGPQQQQQQQDRTSRPLLRLAPAAGRCRPSLRCVACASSVVRKTRHAPEAYSERRRWCGPATGSAEHCPRVGAGGSGGDGDCRIMVSLQMQFCPHAATPRSRRQQCRLVLG